MAVAVVAATIGAAACSSSGPAKGSPPAATPLTAPAPTPTAAPRPSGPAATFSRPLTAGKGISLLSAKDLTSTSSLRVAEYTASGTATAYTATSRPDDGRWTLRPTGSAGYRTRIIVRTPADPARFNGTVLVEWLNVSAGADSSPDYTYARNEILRSGYAYVGVSAQQVGIDGSTPGDIASQLAAGLALPGLRKADPARYGTLHHPGDAYSYDMFTQVARGLRERSPAVLGGLTPQRVIAVGESQSAARLTTYVDGVQPLTREFDGFLIHSRGGGAAPLTGSGDGGSVVNGAVRIRTDLTWPVLMFETETDVSLLRYDRAEQPDTDRIRLWEVAGTAHADAYQIGAATGTLLGCAQAVNDGPQHYVLTAAVVALDRWTRIATPPPAAPRFEHVANRLARDARGIVRGGIRTPPVDAPAAVESGEPAPGGKVICSLFGTSTPLPAAALIQLYGDRAGYLTRYDAAARGAAAAGYVLTADLPELQAAARSVTFPPA